MIKYIKFACIGSTILYFHRKNWPGQMVDVQSTFPRFEFDSFNLNLPCGGFCYNVWFFLKYWGKKESVGWDPLKLKLYTNTHQWMLLNMAFLQYHRKIKKHQLTDFTKRKYLMWLNIVLAFLDISFIVYLNVFYILDISYTHQILPKAFYFI